MPSPPKPGIRGSGKSTRPCKYRARTKRSTGLIDATLTLTAIAAILSDIDANIDALEAKLAKARQLKQGMMHELLTGRVRLSVDMGRAAE